MQPKFGRTAAKPQVQLLPGPITPLNENPSLSRSRESSPQTNPRAWPSGEMPSGGRMDGRTDGRMDGWTVGLAPLASEWTDGWTDRMDGWTVGLALLALEWTDGWTDGRRGSLRSLRDGRTSLNFLEFLEIS